MGTQTKGKCKYCGMEYTKAYMVKHLTKCKGREARIAAETGTKKCGYFELVISDKYSKAYWLVIEVGDDAVLGDLDAFLRDIWVDCCGHMSAFNIGGESYEYGPGEMSFWGERVKSMKCKLKSVLQKGMKFEYEYDFGSTTELIITVQDYRQSFWKKEKVTILSRNNPPEIMCDECHNKKAVSICTECIYDGKGFLCEDCMKSHECGEEMQLDLCNSPRMGVCGYDGSSTYGDEFVPDNSIG